MAVAWEEWEEEEEEGREAACQPDLVGRPCIFFLRSMFIIIPVSTKKQHEVNKGQ